MSLPPPVTDYLLEWSVQFRSPAYLFLGFDHYLRDWGGDLSRYGLTDLKQGEEVSRRLVCLEGALPLAKGPVSFPCVKLDCGRSVDIHLFEDESGIWVLLLDAASLEKERRIVQQQANEIALIRERRKGGAVVDAGNVLSDLLSHLDLVILLRTGERSFQVISTPPDWFMRVYPASAVEKEFVPRKSGFLSNFLVDAEKFWESNKEGQLKSGLWLEKELSEKGQYLEASAIGLGTRKLLAIERPGQSYRESIQVARERGLRTSRLAREEKALKQTKDKLEMRVAEKTKQLHQANRQLADELAELWKAQEALRQSETALRQFQKMDAMGKLVAGLTHDMNNILTVILGSSELLLLDLDPSSPHTREVQEIKEASDRAAMLLRQLLAFARKQVLELQNLDLNVVVANMERMLRRMIGAQIRFSFLPGHNLRKVRADPNQIEQVIVNLVVNSRDAMPDGGSLTIQTANVQLEVEQITSEGVCPGQYVMLAVTDTGCGMDPAIQVRIFEPFFTTKEQGKGTGIGLSTVYGIVKQSGGSIAVASEPGQGTTFRIYLPVVRVSTSS